MEQIRSEIETTFRGHDVETLKVKLTSVVNDYPELVDSYADEIIKYLPTEIVVKALDLIDVGHCILSRIILARRADLLDYAISRFKVETTISGDLLIDAADRGYTGLICHILEDPRFNVLIRVTTPRYYQVILAYLNTHVPKLVSSFEQRAYIVQP